MPRPLFSRLWPIAGSCLLLFLLGASPWGLWERDEGRYADVAREMLERRDFITPRIDGTVFLDKPPLVYWMTAASLALWGPGETGARFGLLLFALGTLLVTRRIGFLLYGRRGANLSAIVLASSVLFYTASHVLTLDLALAFFVSLTLFFFLKGYGAGEAGTGSYAGMFAAAAGGVMTKGLIGALLPALAIASFLTLRRDWRRMRDLPWARGILLFLLIAAPWYIAVSIANPEFPRYFFLREHLERFASVVHRHQGGWWYYLAVLAAGLMPWSLMLPAWLLGRRAPGACTGGVLRREAPAFLWSWVAPGMLFFTVAQSKLPLYILPLMPPVALLIASALERHLEQKPHRWLFLWPSIVLIVYAGLKGVIWLHPLERESLAQAGVGPALTAVAAALAGGALLLGYLLARRGRHLAGLAAAACLWMAACLALFTVIGRVNFVNETGHFASVLRAERQRGERVCAYRCYLRGLPFYLHETVGLVSPHSDDIRLGWESSHDQATFPDEASLFASLRGDSRAFVVVRDKDLQALQRSTGWPLYILAQSDQYDLVSNRLGARRLRELQEVLGTLGLDLDSAIDRAARSVDGSEVTMIEIERLAGVPTCALEVRRGGSRFEVSFPIDHPALVSVSQESQASEETGEEDHLLRLAPPTGSVAEIPRLLRAAAGGWRRGGK